MWLKTQLRELFLACRLGLVDYDTVELNNLHRQILHSEGTVDVPKVLSASASLIRWLVPAALPLFATSVQVEFTSGMHSLQCCSGQFQCVVDY
eukprot:m.38960 g.38960  ORF g.38960 m.38960 type:complete len:93 (+) comp32654_c0_seq2:580-858(+)